MFNILAADVYICKVLELMNQPKIFICFGPHEGTSTGTGTESVFRCSGVLVSYAAEEFLLLHRSTLE